MRKRYISFVLCCLLATSYAHADPAQQVERHIPHAQKVGESRLSVLLWDVYDATLYAPGGTFNADQPHALSIRYLREIEGPDIADRSIEEMKKQGFSDAKMLDDWHNQMLRIFPNVSHGSELTAVLTPQKTTVFYHDGKPAGTIKDPLFGKHFFAIWLSKKTSEPALRKALLGQP